MKRKGIEIEWFTLKMLFTISMYSFVQSPIYISLIEHTYIKNWRGVFSGGVGFNIILTFAVLMGKN